MENQLSHRDRYSIDTLEKHSDQKKLLTKNFFLFGRQYMLAYLAGNFKVQLHHQHSIVYR